MNCTCIPYTRVPKSTPLLTDYLYHFDRVAGCYNGAPSDLASYKRLAEQVANSSGRRRELIATLKRQNQAFGSPAETFANIERLADSGTFAVVTGQQVGLLSGPAFTLYKALTAVRLAEHLTSQGLPCVPVFWLATEDHDLEEVAATATLDEEYELTALTDAGERPAPRASVGNVKLSGEIEGALKALEDSLPPGEIRDQLLADLRACYRPGVTWGHAFGCLMARLFGRWGVVLLDPLDADVHRLTARVYERSLTQAVELRTRLLDRSQALVRAGYHAQVHVGEESTLLFLTTDGNRSPVSQQGSSFAVDGPGDASLANLQTRLQSQPLDFTPNVLLRPIVQDTLLPTVAYVAGPSELAYLGQAQALYPAFGRPMPVVFLRAGFTLIDPRVERLMEKYHVSVEDAWHGDEHLERKIAAAGFAEGWAERCEQSERDLTALLERLRQDVESLDSTLLDTLSNAQEKMKYQLERLKGKLSRAALQKSEILARHTQLLRRFLFPRKGLQEREVSGIYFLGRVGHRLLDGLREKIQTASSDHQVLTY